MTAALAAGICICWLLASCSETSSNSTPVVYPPSWPVKQFTAPAGAVAANLPASYESPMVEKQPLSAMQPELADAWALAFRYSGTWDQAWAHTDACLKPLGYLLSDRSVPGEVSTKQAASHLLESIYVNEQRTHILRLTYDGKIYVLKAVVYAKPESEVMPIFSKAHPIP